MVTLLATLVVLIVTVPKFKATGLKTTGNSPVPVKVMVCGLLAALSVMVMLPDTAPATVGANVTLILQVLPAAMLVPQVLV
jgi:hypothetical protein